MLMMIFLFLVLSLVIVFTLFRNILYVILDSIASVIDHIFNRKSRQTGGSTRYGAGNTTRIHRKAPKKEKIFQDNEGEYVDYEEIH